MNSVEIVIYSIALTLTSVVAIQSYRLRKKRDEDRKTGRDES